LLFYKEKAKVAMRRHETTNVAMRRHETSKCNKQKVERLSVP
jgi:hypothetical protein